MLLLPSEQFGYLYIMAGGGRISAYATLCLGMHICIASRLAVAIIGVEE